LAAERLAGERIPLWRRSAGR
jgi:gamma-glutamyl hercynylcysteine S-oxide synthase